MRRRDLPTDADDRDDDIPELPIPRPNEPSATAPRSSEAPRPIAPPSLGASFTSAFEHDVTTKDQDGRDAADEPSEHALRMMAWELAAKLTSGMLANPGRSTASVKDAMGLFDQFLHEMHTYVRIASEFELDLGVQRRSSHSDYFRGSSEAGEQPGATEQPAVKHAPVVPVPTSAPRKPAPTQPQPSQDYRPIPPGMRRPHDVDYANDLDDDDGRLRLGA